MSRNFLQSDVVQPLLTDLYQIAMAYGYWKSNKINDKGVFEFFFRKNPFQGEFTIFAGLEECLIFIKNFGYTDEDVSYLKKVLPNVEDEFFEILKSLSTKEVNLYAFDEGSVVFPLEPLMRIEGPLIIGQLLETTLLNLINYASLMATNAARFRMAAGKAKLYEFGLRRAQGPDGALSASRYSYVGGFDGTSNVLAGKRYGIPVKGTQGHSYVLAFTSIVDLQFKHLKPQNGGEEKDLLELAMTFRKDLKSVLNVHLVHTSNDGELAAFISFAIAFPNNFSTVIDTYDAIKSGLVNFCAVALALNELQYRAIGVRIDSGDLAYLSLVAREYFTKIAKHYSLDWFQNILVLVSNDINEGTILSLNEQEHSIDSFGIGTHLVTCQKQPALGCVCKLVEVNGTPRMKISQESEKVTIPGRKEVFRLYNENKDALIDIIQECGEDPPGVGEKVLCRHPFVECKRAFVKPRHVVRLHKLYWSEGNICQPLPNLEEIKGKIKTELGSLRADIKRSLNPTPYKVSLSDQLYSYLHSLWLENAAIGELY